MVINMVSIKKEYDSQDSPQGNAQNPIEEPTSNHDIQKKIKKEVIEELSQRTEKPIILNDENVREFARSIRKTARQQASLLGEGSEIGSTISGMLELIKFLVDKTYPKTNQFETLNTQESSPGQPIADVPSSSVNPVNFVNPVNYNELAEEPSIKITNLNSRRRGITAQKLPKYKKRRLELEEQDEINNEHSIEKPVNQQIQSTSIEKPVNQQIQSTSIEKPVNQQIQAISIEKSVNQQIQSTSIEKPVNQQIQSTSIEKRVNQQPFFNASNATETINGYSNNRHDSNMNEHSRNDRRERNTRWDKTESAKKKTESAKKKKEDRREYYERRKIEGKNRRDDSSDRRKDYPVDNRSEKSSHDSNSKRWNDDYSRDKDGSSRKPNEYKSNKSSRQHNPDRRNDYPELTSSIPRDNDFVQIESDKFSSSRKEQQSSIQQTSKQPIMERQFFPSVRYNQRIPPSKQTVIQPVIQPVIPAIKKPKIIPTIRPVVKKPKIVPTAKRPTTSYPGLTPMIVKLPAKVERPSSPVDDPGESQEETPKTWSNDEITFFRNIISRLNATTERQSIIDELRNTNKLRSFLQFKSRYQNQKQ